jgi:AcrR family transcriptional regulator
MLRLVSSVTVAEGLRERKRRITRQTIAREALELFARQGYADTTIPQIAEASGVSPRTVSAYFPHKEDLAFPDSDEAFGRLEAAFGDLDEPR